MRTPLLNLSSNDNNAQLAKKCNFNFRVLQDISAVKREADIASQRSQSAQDAVSAHIMDTGNPHKVTASQIGVESGAQKNVQADWNTDDTSLDSFIKNKPVIYHGAFVLEANTGSIAVPFPAPFSEVPSVIINQTDSVFLSAVHVAVTKTGFTAVAQKPEGQDRQFNFIAIGV